MRPARPLLSPDWYRIAAIRAQVRPGVRVSRQEVRGEYWYVLSDPVSGRHHRFNEIAYRLIASCDGIATLDEAWAARVAEDRDTAPTQDEAIHILTQAFAANLMVGDVTPDAAQVVRAQSSARRRRLSNAVNPFAFRLPLWDPDRFLARHVGRVRWLFSTPALVVAGVVMLFGLLLLAANAPAFGRFAREHATAGGMLLLFWIAYPLVKTIHELAHAFAVKHYGGEVHEMGVTVLLLTPVPYVDASASIAFEAKGARMMVAAAGILVEVFLGSLAMMLWLVTEPGLVSDAAFAVATIGIVSTVLVNGNPLLRFDGYYVFSDLLELPNLATRSNRYWHCLAARWLLLARHVRFGGAARGETPWLFAYAPLSWAWRVAMLAGFALLMQDLGELMMLAIAAYGLWIFVAKPLARGARFVADSHELTGMRGRAAVLACVAAGGVAALLLVAPVPHRTWTPGVVWLAEDAIVRNGVEGFVDAFLVADGERVAAGTPILRLANDQLMVDLAGLDVQIRRKDIERKSLVGTDLLKAAMLEEEIARLHTDRARLRERIDLLVVRAQVDGAVVLDRPDNLVGRWIAQGQTVAHVLPARAPMVRTVIRHGDIALVRERPGRVSVTFADAHGPSHAARLEVQTPRATTALPSAALGEAGGGSIALDATDTSGRTARESRFQVDVRLDDASIARAGARALVTFDHGESTVAGLVAQLVRRSFLRFHEA